MRLFMMYLGPYTLGGDFRDKGIAGMTRFLNRVWRATQLATARRPRDDEVRERRRHRLIKRSSDDIARAAVQHRDRASDGVRARARSRGRLRDARRRVDAETLLKLLAPFAPFVTEELWHRIGHDTSVHERWDVARLRRRARRSATRDGRDHRERQTPRRAARSTRGRPRQALTELALAQPRVAELLAGRRLRAR